MTHEEIRELEESFQYGIEPRPANVQRPEPELLTIAEVAERLRTDVAHIYSLTRARRLHRGLQPMPHRKVGRVLYFRWGEIEQWLDNQPGFPVKKGA